MTLTQGRPGWLTPHNIMPAVVMFLGLFGITWAFDYAFDRMGINPASTLANNFMIGYFGAAIILYYQIKMYRDQKLARAEEKAQLFEELRHYIHQELSAIDVSATLESRDDRVRRIEEATRRIASFMEDFEPVATVSRAAASRATPVR